MIVCKFGGSSVASKEGAKNIKQIVSNSPHRKIIVVSALGKNEKYKYKITDKLFELYYTILDKKDYIHIINDIFERHINLSKELNVKIDWNKHKKELVSKITSKNFTKEYIVSRGEYYSALIYSKFLKLKFLDSKNYIKFDKFNKIDTKSTKKQLKKLNFNQKYIIGGYYGSNKQNNICVFSRGGSDITGAIICNLLDFKIYENYTDVSGVYNKNPNLFKNAQKLPALTYNTAIALAKNGNEVVHCSALEIMQKSSNVLLVKNSKKINDYGTIILDDFFENNNLFTCLSKVEVLIFKNITPTALNYLYNNAEVLHIIKQDDKFYVMATNIYTSLNNIKDSPNFIEKKSCYLFTYFSTKPKINNKNIHLIKKLNKITKSLSVMSCFITVNKFIILCEDKYKNDIVFNTNKVFIQ